MNLVSKKIQNKIERFKFWNLNEKTIFESFEDIYRWPFQYNGGQPTVEVIGKSRESLFYSNGYLNNNLVKEYYNQGYTIIISRVNLLTKELRKYSNILQSEYHNLNVNLYMSKGKKIVSFPLHNHDYSVIVKNVKGSSTWIKGDEIATLNGQNVLYLPKSVNHQVVEIHKSKMSLTCNLV